MRTRFAIWLLIGMAPLAAACEGARDALQRHTDVVARAAGQELTVDAAADILAGQDRVPNEPQVVEAVANLWIDYTLLARAVAEDSTAESIDLSPMVKTQLEQTLVYRLRDRVINVDTLISDQELREIYEERMPGAQVRARHILLTYPPNATQQQRDSVRALAGELRRRALAGADFAQLARQYSQDPGSAPEGGDLGFFGRGQMVKPFDSAAFALKPGQISDPVESPFGIHVIRLEERRAPEFDQVRASFLEEVKTERILSAESTYIAGLVEPANVQLAKGAVQVARELARQPTVTLPRRAARRALTKYRGGAFTAQEFLEFVQARPPAFRTRLIAAPDDAVEGLLRDLTRAELLVNEARNLGIQVSEAERDSMMADARRFFLNTAGALGLSTLEPAQGMAREDAAQQHILALLKEMVRGEREVVALGTVSFALRKRYDARLYSQNVPRVVDRVAQLSAASQPAAPLGGQLPPAPNAPRPIPQPSPPAQDTTP